MLAGGEAANGPLGSTTKAVHRGDFPKVGCCWSQTGQLKALLFADWGSRTAAPSATAAAREQQHQDGNEKSARQCLPFFPSIAGGHAKESQKTANTGQQCAAS